MYASLFFFFSFLSVSFLFFSVVFPSFISFIHSGKENLLQKKPSLRYDWDQFFEHPYLKAETWSQSTLMFDQKGSMPENPIPRAEEERMLALQAKIHTITILRYGFFFSFFSFLKAVLLRKKEKTLLLSSFFFSSLLFFFPVKIPFLFFYFPQD